MIKTRTTTKNLAEFMSEQLFQTRGKCKKFGCGKQLTLADDLCSKYCINCSGVKKIDIMQVLKMK